MIEIVVAYDERDKKLGDYFESCKNDLIATIEQLGGIKNTISEIPAKKCNRAYIDIALKHLKEISFLIIAYMHGTESQLIANNGAFVQVGDDNSFFKYSLFYTNSCLCGKLLGPDLITHQCHTFIGFDEEISALLGDNKDISIKCDNFGITAFLTQDITVFEAYDQMRTNYSQEITKMLSLGDILSAGVLVNAREALVFLGNKDLKKEGLFNE